MLTRPQAPTCQAWSLMGGQSSCTQASEAGGRSSKEHAVVWSRDPSSPRQVTLRFRIPAPQLTEHCKDQAVSRSLSSPRGAVPGQTARGPTAGTEGGWPSTAHILGSEKPSHSSEVTQPADTEPRYLFHIPSFKS